MNFLKNWIINLILSIVFLFIGILLLIPSISKSIVSIITGCGLIIFYILVVFPKYNKIKNVNTEWVIWIILESIFIIALAVLAVINQQTSIDLFFTTLNLSDIIGLVLILEGIIGLIKLCNIINLSNNNIKQNKLPKYLYIVMIIIGTYIFTDFNITDKSISIILSIICFIIFILSMYLLFKHLPNKKQTSTK